MSLKEYLQRYEIKGQFSDPNLVFKRVKDLLDILHLIDMDVYLPSKGCNLQRDLVWDVTQKRGLIESILLERQIPSLRLISLINEKGGQDIIQVIDGKQRLSAIIEFLQNKFSIVIDGIEYFYNTLPLDFKNQLDFYHIKGQIYYQHYNRQNQIVPIPDEDKIKWFCLINFSGTPQDEKHKTIVLGFLG